MTERPEPLPLRVDIVSDVVCPWCIIGYLQLRRALETLSGEFTAEIHWQPFELNPDMPPEGQDLREHMARKYGSTPAQGRGARERLTALGDELGFRFNYDDDMRMRNTFSAHQLLHWAGEQGRQTALKLALFEAFFTRGEDVNDAALLAEVAARAGLDAVAAAAVLADGRYADAVRASQRDWQERDVHAVPTVFFQGRYMVPGAQESPTFERILRKVHARTAA